LELPIALQLYQASSALLLGFAAGLFYDILKTIRRRIDRRGVTMLFDVLFWLAIALALFAQTMLVGFGAVRIFMLLANIGGATMYFLVLSVPTCFLLGKIADGIVRIYLIATKPLDAIWSKCENIARNCKKGFRNLIKQYIMGNNYCLRTRLRRQKERTGGEPSAQKEKRKHLRETGRTRASRLCGDHLSRTPQSNRTRPDRRGGTWADRRRLSERKRNL